MRERLERGHVPFLLSYDIFNRDKQVVLLMLAWVFVLDDDTQVLPFQFGLDFELKKEKIQRNYDFSEVIARNILNQLKNYRTDSKFRYSSFLAHLVLHQNFEYSRENVLACRVDERSYLQPVSVWTHMISRTRDYYWFTYYFLGLMLQELLPQPMGCFSPEVLQQMRISPNPVDYFLGVYFTFIIFHGFPNESFQIPEFVIDKVFMLE